MNRIARRGVKSALRTLSSGAAADGYGGREHLFAVEDSMPVTAPISP